MSYKFDSFVNRNEAMALKEMIFKRVQERSEAMSGDVQADVMDMARDSFISNNNPFAKIVEQSAEKTLEKQPAPAVEAAPKAENIGFPIKEKPAQIVSQAAVVREQISSRTIQNNMAEARASLSNNKSFMGALNFLNTQGAISLARTRADKFEIVA